ADRRGVDVEDARVDLVHGLEGLVDVLRVDRSGQAVLDAVADRDRFLERVHRDHRDHGTEDLFAGDAHLRRAVAEDRGLVEVAAGRSTSRETAAAGQELRPLVLPDLHVALDRLQLALVDAGPHLDAGLEAVADAQRLRTLDESVDELLVDLLVHGHAAGRRAALAARPEATPYRAIDREVEPRVVQHHDDVLAAHLEVAVLERGSARLGDLAADARGSRERHDPDVLVVHERRADLAAAARHHVDDAPRQPGFLEGLD